MSERKLLYLGDTSLREAASYLAGVMSHFSIRFDYLPSDVPPSSAMLEQDYRAFVISDYPARNFPGGQLDLIVERVRAGAGLVMIGGWESFTGFGGDYQKTVLCEALPVLMQAEDDRVNCAQPCLVAKVRDHPVVQGLPFDDVAPGIGGFNRILAKPEAVEILSSRRYQVHRRARDFEFEAAPQSDPLLVAGTFGKGRVAAFASDAAPHWVGGLVDWGDGRVTACAEGSNPIEVGNWYARFFGQLLAWTAQIPMSNDE
jgi:uncharacterized membrane protein